MAKGKTPVKETKKPVKGKTAPKGKTPPKAAPKTKKTGY